MTVRLISLWVPWKCAYLQTVTSFSRLRSTFMDSSSVGPVEGLRGPPNQFPVFWFLLWCILEEVGDWWGRAEAHRGTAALTASLLRGLIHTAVVPALNTAALLQASSDRFIKPWAAEHFLKKDLCGMQGYYFILLCTSHSNTSSPSASIRWRLMVCFACSKSFAVAGGESSERAGQETNIQHCGAVCGAETGQHQLGEGAEWSPDSWCWSQRQLQEVWSERIIIDYILYIRKTCH